jgi:hypothetical protein
MPNQLPPPQDGQQTPPINAAGTPYDFIMGSSQPTQTPKTKLPGSNSALGRVLLVGGGLIVLLIVFAIVKSILFKGPDFSGFISVAQDQQVLISLTSDETLGDQPNLSLSSMNFAATAGITATSAQSQILQYLTTHKQKVKQDKLVLKVKTKTIDELTSAASSGNFDQTFRDIMSAALKTYMADLDAAYNTAGKNGQALLKSDYAQAVLLQNQLSGDTN